jgi:hypothetical protein
LLQSEAVEPRRNVHARLPDAILAAPSNLTSICRHTRKISAAGRRHRIVVDILREIDAGDLGAECPSYLADLNITVSRQPVIL